MLIESLLMCAVIASVIAFIQFDHDREARIAKRIIKMLSANPGLNCTQISYQLRVDEPTVFAVLSKLESDGHAVSKLITSGQTSTMGTKVYQLITS